MHKLNEIFNYRDEEGNSIECSQKVLGDILLNFKGKNNRIVVNEGARISKLRVVFDCDNGTLHIGSNTKVGGFDMNIRIGQDSTVRIGNNVSTTSTCVVSAVEGTEVTFGDDVMIASNNQVRADDGHPIFDVLSGKRLNHSKNITVGNHVWLGVGACVLGGTNIGSGTVIGLGSIVKGKIPNNVIAVGSPARVVRRDIAWERPHLSLVKPFYKPDATSVARTEEYWRLTENDAQHAEHRLCRFKRLKHGAEKILRSLKKTKHSD